MSPGCGAGLSFTTGAGAAFIAVREPEPASAQVQAHTFPLSLFPSGKGTRRSTSDVHGTWRSALRGKSETEVFIYSSSSFLSPTRSLDRLDFMIRFALRVFQEAGGLFRSILYHLVRTRDASCSISSARFFASRTEASAVSWAPIRASLISFSSLRYSSPRSPRGHPFFDKLLVFFF